MSAPILTAQALPTWVAVRDHLRGRYELDDEDDDMVSLTLALPERDRTQLVRVHHSTDSREVPWIELRTAVCRTEHLKPEDALAENASLPFGTFGLIDDEYDLEYRFPLRALTTARLDGLLRRIARDGDALEAHYTGGADEY